MSLPRLTKYKHFPVYICIDIKLVPGVKYLEYLVYTGVKLSKYDLAELSRSSIIVL